MKNLLLAALAVACLAAAPVYAGGCLHSIHNRRVVVTPVQSDYYYRVQSQQNLAHVANTDVDALLQTRKQLSRLESGLIVETLRTSQQLRQYSHAMTAAPEDDGRQPIPLQSVGLEGRVVDIMTRHKCNSCHAQNGQTKFLAGGGLLDLTATKRWEIVGRTAAGQMPPGEHPKLSEDEVLTLRQWASQ